MIEVVRIIVGPTVGLSIIITPVKIVVFKNQGIKRTLLYITKWEEAPNNVENDCVG